MFAYTLCKFPIVGLLKDYLILCCNVVPVGEFEGHYCTDLFTERCVLVSILPDRQTMCSPLCWALTLSC